MALKRDLNIGGHEVVELEVQIIEPGTGVQGAEQRRGDLRDLGDVVSDLLTKDVELLEELK